ncbi:MAG TPA: hypothetical protein VGD17_08945, partial [Chitinophagaceae bacterium]
MNPITQTRRQHVRMNIVFQMLSRTALLMLLVNLTLQASAQQCDCLTDFRFVKQHMEKNHPAFNSDIKDPNQPAYKSFVASLEKKITNDPAGKFCIAYLKQYILYLKDHHIHINGSIVQVREDSIPAVEAFLRSPAYLSTERIETDSAAVIEYFRQLK